MPELSPKEQQRFLKKLEKTVKSCGRLAGSTNIDSFDDNLQANLTHAFTPRPWVMCLDIAYYRVHLRRQEQRLAAMADCSLAELQAQIENIESLRFAAQFGHRGNAQQRACCLQLINQYRVAPPDAPFLVWARVISLRRPTIIFGHWDWICGICVMPVVSYVFLWALCIALSIKPSPEVKAIFTTLYLAIGCGAFTFYKSITFDVFRVGLRYFKPDGWRYTPLPR
jgi:hypothetical protein